MGRRNILELIRENCEPIVEDLGYDLVDLEFVREEGDYFLRFFIGKAGGVGIDDCQIVSEAVSDKLDVLDPIEQSYYLEVSSPGLDRPLETDKDLKRNIGMKVEVNLYKKIDNKKVYIGELVGFSDEYITIMLEDGTEKNIDRQFIANVKLVIEI